MAGRHEFEAGLQGASDAGGESLKRTTERPTLIVKFCLAVIPEIESEAKAVMT